MLKTCRHLQLLLTLAVISLQALLVLTQPRSRDSHPQVLTQQESRKPALLVLTPPANSKFHLQMRQMRFHLKVS